jgi:hypothetical protein
VRERAHAPPAPSRRGGRRRAPRRRVRVPPAPGRQAQNGASIPNRLLPARFDSRWSRGRARARLPLQGRVPQREGVSSVRAGTPGPRPVSAKCRRNCRRSRTRARPPLGWIVGIEQTILTARVGRALRLLSSLSRGPFPRPIAIPSSCEQRCSKKPALP